MKIAQTAQLLPTLFSIGKKLIFLLITAGMNGKKTLETRGVHWQEQGI